MSCFVAGQLARDPGAKRDSWGRAEKTAPSGMTGVSDFRPQGGGETQGRACKSLKNNV